MKPLTRSYSSLVGCVGAAAVAAVAAVAATVAAAAAPAGVAAAAGTVAPAAVAGTSLGGGLTNRQYGEVCEIFGTCIPMEFAAQGKFNLFLVPNTAAIY